MLKADGTKLIAKLGINEETIAVIDNSKTTATVTYQDGVFAKDVLNYAGAQNLAKGQTLSATIAISAGNGCDKPLIVNNNPYNVRFLRPITVNVSKAPNLQDGKDSRNRHLPFLHRLA